MIIESFQQYLKRVLIEESIKNCKTCGDMVYEAKLNADPISREVMFNFPSGRWKKAPELIADVNKKLFEIFDFIKGHAQNDITIQVEASESAITNYDTEVTPKVKVDKLVLAERRAKTIREILEAELKAALASNLIDKMPTFLESKLIQGKETAPGPAADAEQYTKAIITANVTDPKKCLINMKIVVDYKSDPDTPDSEYKYHECNNAVFMLYANGVPVKLTGSTDTNINLNNGGTGGARRRVELTVTPEDAEKILAVNSTGIEFVYRCMVPGYDGCHSDAAHITIFGPDGKKLLPGTFVTTSDKDNKGFNMKLGDTVTLLKTDNCGKNGVVVGYQNGGFKKADAEWMETWNLANTQFVPSYDDNNQLKPDRLANILKYLVKDASGKDIFNFPNSDVKYMGKYSRFYQNKGLDVFLKDEEVSSEAKAAAEKYLSEHPELKQGVEKRRLAQPADAQPKKN